MLSSTLSPQLTGAETAGTSGIAVLAHIGGFVTGAALARAFASHELVAARRER